MIGDSRNPAMNISAAKFFRCDFFARRGLHERRSAKKDRSLVPNDDGFIAHRRNIRSTRGAGAHYRRHLVNAGGRHASLITKNSSEVIAIGKDFSLKRKKRAAGIDQV